MLPQHKDLIFCDDKSTHADLSLHCPTIPENFPKKGFCLILRCFTSRHKYQSSNSKYNHYYQRDYALNLEPQLALRRYLPKLLQLLEVLNECFLHAGIRKTHALIKTYSGIQFKNKTTSEKLQLPEILKILIEI